MAAEEYNRRILCPHCLRIFKVPSAIKIRDKIITNEHIFQEEYPSRFSRRKLHLYALPDDINSYVIMLPNELTLYHIHHCKHCITNVNYRVSTSQIIVPLNHSCIIATPLLWDHAIFEPSNYLKWSSHKLWNYRVLGLIYNAMKLQSLMAWCNTIGGAHSSLGDSMNEHAVKAGHVSLNQLALSTEMGDSLMRTKSRLFLAFSFLQQRKLPQAKRLIKSEYSNLMMCGELADQKLVNMCLSAWNRYKSLKERSVN